MFDSLLANSFNIYWRIWKWPKGNHRPGKCCDILYANYD